MADDLSAAARIFSELAARLHNHPLGKVNSVLASTESTSTASTTPRTAENSEIFPSSSTTPVVPSTSSSSVHSKLAYTVSHHFTSNSGSASCIKEMDNRAAPTTVNSKAKTITRKFMCLADKEQYDIPDREEQRELLLAGPGEVKVAIPENA